MYKYSSTLIVILLVVNSFNNKKGGLGMESSVGALYFVLYLVLYILTNIGFAFLLRCHSPCFISSCSVRMMLDAIH